MPRKSVPIPVAFTVNGVTVQAESAAQADKFCAMLQEQLADDGRTPQISADVILTIHAMIEVERKATPPC